MKRVSFTLQLLNWARAVFVLHAHIIAWHLNCVSFLWQCLGELSSRVSPILECYMFGLMLPSVQIEHLSCIHLMQPPVQGALVIRGLGNHKEEIFHGNSR